MYIYIYFILTYAIHILHYIYIYICVDVYVYEYIMYTHMIRLMFDTCTGRLGEPFILQRCSLEGHKPQAASCHKELQTSLASTKGAESPVWLSCKLGSFLRALLMITVSHTVL